jgi:RND family efflux transporter MFP subunit
MRLRHAVVVVASTLLMCACGRNQPGDTEQELPSLDVTSWTDKTELFMEYPVLAAGGQRRFAVHLTRLSDFSALTTGRPRVELTPASGGAVTVLQGQEPSRPGVFRVEGTLPAAGKYRWALAFDAPGLTDRHELGEVTIFPNDAAAIADAESRSADAAAISYLKEQQWTNPFATELVREAELRGTVRAPATIHPLPGGEAIVAAPAPGRFTAAALLSIGDRVTAGQLLGRLEPRLAAGIDRATLEAELTEARASLEGARLEQARAERLLAERAVPARRAEDARRATLVAEARLRAGEARLAQRDETLLAGGGQASGNTFALRAPISGRLAEVMVTLGAAYDEGAPLFRIVRTDRVELDAQVPAADAATARQAVSAAFELPGQSTPVALDGDHTHDSGVIDPTTGALSIQMEVGNPGEVLLVGQVGTALLFTRERRRVPVVPSAAVLMEAGRPYVFVQIGGESFARRSIEIGSRDGDLVGVKSGVKTGERVVTRGAYDVQLASAATGLPAEGHVH